MDYPEVLKARMIRRMTGPGKQSATALGAETGISHSTLSRWLKEAGHVRKVPQKKAIPSTRVREENLKHSDLPRKSQRPQDWSALDRARVILEAEHLTGELLGEFLRERGLHQSQLEQWKIMLETAMASGPRRGLSESKRVKQLEHELRRKDAALAEAAAIIVLQKKAERWLRGEEAVNITKRTASR